jgi:hypothetical protein
MHTNILYFFEVVIEEPKIPFKVFEPFIEAVTLVERRSPASLSLQSRPKRQSKNALFEYFLTDLNLSLNREILVGLSHKLVLSKDRFAKRTRGWALSEEPGYTGLAPVW